VRLLIDSNVYISALAFGGIPAEAVIIAQKSGEIIASAYVIKEVGDTLASKKFRWEQAKIDAAVQALFSKAFIVEPDTIPDLVRDPKDNPVLACAPAAEADYLVTGDKDLLALKACKRPHILTPERFVEQA